MTTYRQARNELWIAVIVVAIGLVVLVAGFTSSYFKALSRLAKLEAAAASSKTVRAKSVVICDDKDQCLDLTPRGVLRTGGELVPCGSDPKKQWWPCAVEVKP